MASKGQPEYRIFLSICGEEAAAAARAATDLIAKTFRSDALYAAGPEDAVAALLEPSELRERFRPVPLPPGATHDDAFAAIVRAFGEQMDFAFVTPDTVVCDLWDLRLAWTARRLPGTATVSPINDSSPWTRLGAGDGTGSVETLDAACYRNSLFAHPEIRSFSKAASTSITRRYGRPVSRPAPAISAPAPRNSVGRTYWLITYTPAELPGPRRRKMCSRRSRSRSPYACRRPC